MSTEVFITSHAIIRYLERHYGMDIETIKKEMLPDSSRSAVLAGSKKYHVGNLEFRVENFCVITCMHRSCDKPERRPCRANKNHTNKKSKNANWHDRKKYTKRIDKRKW